MKATLLSIRVTSIICVAYIALFGLSLFAHFRNDDGGAVIGVPMDIAHVSNYKHSARPRITATYGLAFEPSVVNFSVAAGITNVMVGDQYVLGMMQDVVLRDKQPVDSSINKPMLAFTLGLIPAVLGLGGWLPKKYSTRTTITVICGLCQAFVLIGLYFLTRSGVDGIGVGPII